VEDKRGLRRAAVVRAHALVLLQLEHGAARHAELRGEDAELPPDERVPVARRAPVRHVKLEARKVEADGLPDRLDVRLLQCEVDAEPLEDELVGVARDVRDLELCQL
jgi:hypothetical protein